MPCTAGLERRDYLDFLPKRPQGTTKIFGASAFAGTKTPAALKFSSKGATTDCAETPVNCPHCGQKWRLRRRLRRQPFILLSFSSSKKLRKAQETQSYQRFQCIGHTDFNTSGTNSPHGETGAFPLSSTAQLLAAGEIFYSATLLYTYISRFSVNPHYISRGKNPAKLPP